MYLKNPTPDKLSHLRTYRNKLNHILRIAKKHYFSDKFYNCKYNMKRTWAVVNEVLQKGTNKSSYPSSFKHNNSATSDPNVIANEFNNFFTNISPSLAGAAPGYFDRGAKYGISNRRPGEGSKGRGCQVSLDTIWCNILHLLTLSFSLRNFSFKVSYPNIIHYFPATKFF